MPHVELSQAEIKVVMLGDTNTGKTSLVLRFVRGYYQTESLHSTVGASFLSKKIPSKNGIMCNVQIWDTAGQTQFRMMAPMYYKTASAAIVCYDVTSPKSFLILKEWLEELKPYLSAKSIVLAIAATKSDLSHPSHQPLVPRHEVQALAQTKNAIFVETSAKSNQNVISLFQLVSEQVLAMKKLSIHTNQSPIQDHVRTLSSGSCGSSLNPNNPNMGISQNPSGLSDDIEKSGGKKSEDGMSDGITNLVCGGPFMECQRSDNDGGSACLIC